MARYLKNPDIIKGGKLAARLPIVPSSAYGDAPVDGLIRFNQNSSKVEFYYNGKWNRIAQIGAVTIVKDIFTTVDAQTSYGEMSYLYNSGEESSVVVFVSGVHQVPGTNYQFNGTKYISINPSTGGTANQSIVIINNLNSTDAA